MKTRTYVLVMCGLLTLLSGAALSANEGDLKFVVPFSFATGAKTLPAGTYRVSLATPVQGILAIRGVRAGAFLVSPKPESEKSAESPRPVFNRYHDQVLPASGALRRSQLRAAGNDAGTRGVDTAQRDARLDSGGRRGSSGGRRVASTPTRVAATWSRRCGAHVSGWSDPRGCFSPCISALAARDGSGEIFDPGSSARLEREATNRDRTVATGALALRKQDSTGTPARARLPTARTHVAAGP